MKNSTCNQSRKIQEYNLLYKLNENVKKKIQYIKKLFQYVNKQKNHYTYTKITILNKKTPKIPKWTIKTKNTIYNKKNEIRGDFYVFVEEKHTLKAKKVYSTTLEYLKRKASYNVLRRLKAQNGGTKNYEQNNYHNHHYRKKIQ